MVGMMESGDDREGLLAQCRAGSEEGDKEHRNTVPDKPPLGNKPVTRCKRLDIQGLRAIAIVGVLLFHLWPKVFSNGYLGVDG